MEQPMTKPLNPRPAKKYPLEVLRSSPFVFNQEMYATSPVTSKKETIVTNILLSPLLLDTTLE